MVNFSFYRVNSSHAPISFKSSPFNEHSRERITGAEAAIGGVL